MKKQMESDTPRLNKYLVLCGLGSRRSVENFILNGDIRVNGKTVKDLSTRIHPDNDTVTFKGQILKPLEKYEYLMLNKPRGYITSRSDEMNRPIVMNLLPERYEQEGVVPVGRLDRDTEGLLILTNDGQLTYRLTHPRFKVEKTYLVTLDSPLLDEHKRRIEKGINLYGKKTEPAVINYTQNAKNMFSMTITEGRKRHIRLSFKIFGYKVISLKRIHYGPLSLGRLPSGSYRTLKPAEVKRLKKLFTNS